MTTTTTKPSLQCSACGTLVREVNTVGRQRSAYVMRFRTAHGRRCDGTVTLVTPQTSEQAEALAEYAAAVEAQHTATRELGFAQAAHELAVERELAARDLVRELGIPEHVVLDHI
jgi:hypothetical protein